LSNHRVENGVDTREIERAQLSAAGEVALLSGVHAEFYLSNIHYAL
jgi:hypothetical protein